MEVGVEEEGHRVPGLPALGRGAVDPVLCGLEEVVGPPGHHVTQVDDEGALHLGHTMMACLSGLLLSYSDVEGREGGQAVDTHTGDAGTHCPVTVRTSRPWT